MYVGGLQYNSYNVFIDKFPEIATSVHVGIREKFLTY